MLNGEQMKEVIEELEEIVRQAGEVRLAITKSAYSKAGAHAITIQLHAREALETLKENSIIRSRDNW